MAPRLGTLTGKARPAALQRALKEQDPHATLSVQQA